MEMFGGFIACHKCGRNCIGTAIYPDGLATCLEGRGGVRSRVRLVSVREHERKWHRNMRGRRELLG